MLTLKEMAEECAQTMLGASEHEKQIARCGFAVGARKALELAAAIAADPALEEPTLTGRQIATRIISLFPES